MSMSKNSKIMFPDDFTVIDLETTGLSPEEDSIIEFSAIRVRSGVPVDTFSSLINPEFEIPQFIEDLTGITNEMLKAAPPASKVIPDALSFIGSDILVGHNVGFDIRFLHIENEYVDTMRLFRRLHNDLKHHRLQDLVKLYHLQGSSFHRAMADCEYTLQGLNALKQEAIKQHGSVESFIDFCKPTIKNRQRIKLSDIVSEVEVDDSSPLYGSTFVFTGALERFTRAEAAHIVANLGGSTADNVTKKVNYLVVGTSDYLNGKLGNKTSKMIKAESLMMAGEDIQIIPEKVFMQMIEQ